MIPVSLAAMAVLCCFVSNFYCDSIRFNKQEGLVSNDNGGNNTNNANFDNHIALGPWTWKETKVDTIQDNAGNKRVFVRDVCVALPSSVDIDGTWKAVRAFSIMAPLIGGLATIIIALDNCTYFVSESQWKTLALTFTVVCTLFQGLTFLMFQSSLCSNNPINSVYPSETWDTIYKSDCEWGGASTANVFAVVLYFLAGLAMLKVGAPSPPPRGPAETQAVTYTQTVNADGTTTVEETQVIKGTAVPPAAVGKPDEQPLETPIEKV